MSKRRKRESKAIDPITLEVVRTRLEAIVEEMGATMLRTAHSSIYVECRDYSVAILDRDGGLIAMGQFIPHHQGGMQAALKSIIELRGLESMQPGDIYITNDAYTGGTHTLDVNLFMPLFVGDDLVCFCGAAAHQIDLGGGAPGTYVVGATEVFQEGIVFPRMKAGENGEFFEDFVRLFQRNVRLPEQQKGDLGAMLASLRVGTRNVMPIVEEHSVSVFRNIVAKILDSSEQRLREEILQIPDGTYRYRDVLDGDGIEDRLFKLEVALTIKGSDAYVDFTGTDPQAKGFVNASYWNTRASTFSAFFLFFDPTIPRNDGFFRPIHVTVPHGTLLNPRYPAPIGASTTEGGGRVYDLVLGALGKAWPEQAYACWSMMWVAVYIAGTHPDTGKPFIQAWLDGLANGGGARRDKDGLNACNLSASNMLIPNMEVEEETYPVRFIRRELATDSWRSRQVSRRSGPRDRSRDPVRLRIHHVRQPFRRRRAARLWRRRGRRSKRVLYGLRRQGDQIPAKSRPGRPEERRSNRNAAVWRRRFRPAGRAPAGVDRTGSPAWFRHAGRRGERLWLPSEHRGRVDARAGSIESGARAVGDRDWIGGVIARG